MEINLGGVKLKNPVITASGTFGFGKEYAKFYPLSLLGGVSTKGLTLHPRAGNPPPRIAETPSGMLNSVGLQNPGVEAFIKEELPWLLKQGTAVIANLAGSCEQDYLEATELLSDTGIDMIELNISCPNVKAGGLQFGAAPESVEAITEKVRRVCKKPLMVKLSPNVASIADCAKAAESAGADAVSLINTLLGMRIDLRTRRPILHNNTGGLSGAAVLPVAVRMVYQAAQAVKIPICGLGGVTRYEDALELLLAGACAVQVGTANFSDPYAAKKVAEGLDSYFREHAITEIGEISGKVQMY